MCSPEGLGVSPQPQQCLLSALPRAAGLGAPCPLGQQNVGAACWPGDPLPGLWAPEPRAAPSQKLPPEAP